MTTQKDNFKLLVTLLTVLLGLCLSTVSAATLSPRLENLVNESAGDNLIEVVVFLDSENSKNTANKASSEVSLSRSERLKSVTRALKNFEAPNQDVVRSYLNIKSTTPIVEHWVVPAFTATLTIADIEGLSRTYGVTSIVENSPLLFEEPVEIKEDRTGLAASVSSELQLLNVPSLWQRGLTGRGRLVCSFDTGVESAHTALSSKWRGRNASLQESWYSPVSPNTAPVDAIGHGTHTMGVMVGSTAADTFGVAFEAEWISAGVIDQGRSLTVTISDILQAFQWALNPDGNDNTTDDVPDVILNSWGIPKGLFLPCDNTFWTAIDNVEAAGIVTIFAAGNEGPNPVTMRSPADRASTPLNSFSVGAVDINKVVGSFSSRGPSSCDQSAIKPEIVAPGVSIRSSYKGGTYAYMTGTSMAAPYIAGLVALMRQYNPDATVAQIKIALLSAAQDLGPIGEDNAYGHGFVNAGNLLNYLPSPLMPDFEIVGKQISEDGIALPGETFGLQLLINNASANVEAVEGTIFTADKGLVQLIVPDAGFYFGLGGSTAMNFAPFQIAYDPSFYHGQMIPFKLALSDALGTYFDTLDFNLVVGTPPSGSIGNHANDRLTVTVSDFGPFGCAPGSIYNLNGDGFRFDGSDNLLYEAGIIVGRNSLQMATSVRDSMGDFKPSDFNPFVPLSEITAEGDGGMHRYAIFNDSFSNIPIPIEITQESIHYTDANEKGILAVRYTLENSTLETISGLHFGLLSDFDLGASDELVYDSDLNLIYQTDGSIHFVGLVGIKNVSTFKGLENGVAKTGYDPTALFSLVSTPGISLEDNGSGDKQFLVSTPALNLAPNGQFEVIVAYVAGSSLDELYAMAIRARARFDLPTDADDNDISSLPDGFELKQNYPNPFNPSTTISFSLPIASDIKLEVFNITGQKVKTVYEGKLAAGTHELEWAAVSEGGERVASGVYFYRLATENFSAVRKMVLLK